MCRDRDALRCFVDKAEKTIQDLSELLKKLFQTHTFSFADMCIFFNVTLLLLSLISSDHYQMSTEKRKTDI